MFVQLLLSRLWEGTTTLGNGQVGEEDNSYIYLEKIGYYQQQNRFLCIKIIEIIFLIILLKKLNEVYSVGGLIEDF